MNYLLTHDHSDLDELLDRIFAAFEGSDTEQVYQTIDVFWARLAMHIRAEHLHLFPAILGALESSKHPKENRVPNFEVVRKVIASLHEDHDFFMGELAGAIKQMRDLREKDNKDSANRLLTVRETITVIKGRLETHNEREETDVYGWAERLLNQSELADLNGRMQKELDNLPPRFGRIE
jgi:hemerythrin-like domain-containing protein